MWKYFLSTEFWPRCTNKSDYIDDEDDGEGDDDDGDDGEGDDDDGDDGEGDGPDVAVPVNRITPQLSSAVPASRQNNYKEKCIKIMCPLIF